MDESESTVFRENIIYKEKRFWFGLKWKSKEKTKQEYKLPKNIDVIRHVIDQSDLVLIYNFAIHDNPLSKYNVVMGNGLFNINDEDFYYPIAKNGAKTRYIIYDYGGQNSYTDESYQPTTYAFKWLSNKQKTVFNTIIRDKGGKDDTIDFFNIDLKAISVFATSNDLCFSITGYGRILIEGQLTSDTQKIEWMRFGSSVRFKEKLSHRYNLVEIARAVQTAGRELNLHDLIEKMSSMSDTGSGNSQLNISPPTQQQPEMDISVSVIY